MKKKGEYFNGIWFSNEFVSHYLAVNLFGWNLVEGVWVSGDRKEVLEGDWDPAENFPQNREILRKISEMGKKDLFSENLMEIVDGEDLFRLVCCRGSQICLAAYFVVCPMEERISMFERRFEICQYCKGKSKIKIDGGKHNISDIEFIRRWNSLEIMRPYGVREIGRIFQASIHWDLIKKRLDRFGLPYYKDKESGKIFKLDSIVIPEEFNIGKFEDREEIYVI